MALVKCPECGKEISDQSETCIHCGYPLKKESKETENPSTEEKAVSPTEEKVEETGPKEQEKFEKMVMFLAEQAADPQPMMTEAVTFFEKAVEVSGKGTASFGAAKEHWKDIFFDKNEEVPDEVRLFAQYDDGSQHFVICSWNGAYEELENLMESVSAPLYVMYKEQIGVKAEGATASADTVEKEEEADQKKETVPVADEKTVSTEKLSGIKKALHPILSGIHKIAPGPLKKVRPVYILSSFILIIAIIAGVVGYNVYESNTLKGPEITAAKCIKEYKSMMKDPASFTLCGNPLVVDGGYAGESSAGKTLVKTFVYIPASGTNSYGGMVTGVGVFVNGDYLCDIDDIKKQDDVDEEYLTKLYAALHYVGWSNYGDEYRNESIKEGYPISKATEVSAEKIGKNLHVKVDID